MSRLRKTIERLGVAATLTFGAPEMKPAADRAHPVADSSGGTSKVKLDNNNEQGRDILRGLQDGFKKLQQEQETADSRAGIIEVPVNRKIDQTPKQKTAAQALRELYITNRAINIDYILEEERRSNNRSPVGYFLRKRRSSSGFITIRIEAAGAYKIFGRPEYPTEDTQSVIDVKSLEKIILQRIQSTK